MIDFLARIFGVLMNWCHSAVPNWVASIALFTLITKVVLLPVSLWANANGLKMVSILPEINRLKARYYGDRERIGEEQTALYKREKYSPLLTMVPLALQIIILLGLIGVIVDPTTAGLGDSERAMGYVEPWDELSADDPEGCPFGEENEEEPADQDSAEDDIPTIEVRPDDSEKE